MMEAQYSHVDVMRDEVGHHQVIADLGKVHGVVLVLGQDVAVGAVLQQEAHYVSVPPLTALEWMERREDLGPIHTGSQKQPESHPNCNLMV